MNMIDIIQKKKHGLALSRDELKYWIHNAVSQEIPDYQSAALLMAIWFKGLNEQETLDLTLEMLASGDVIDLSPIEGIKVDKHSTGGVADTTTLICAPLVAACGGKVAKMSGRGLGHTGGTLDKLESIPGLSIQQNMEDFFEIVRTRGLSVIGQTANLVPADKLFYSLRDVTGTVDNISLIAGSIMSKKLASGSDAIVLDVKTGSGAFMQDEADALQLAETMVKIGNGAGKQTIALVTDMNQPLGNAIGNALEVQEAVEILHGQHREGRLAKVSFSLAVKMLEASDIGKTTEEREQMVQQALNTGAGLESLSRMIEAQGGDPGVCEDTSKLPQAARIVEIRSQESGYIRGFQTDEIGMSSVLLGAGRMKKNDPIDPAVGIWMEAELGERYEEGDLLARFYVNDETQLEDAKSRFLKAVYFAPERQVKPALIRKEIR
jgi:pyrimidine-nucleoside phosphorylase